MNDIVNTVADVATQDSEEELSANSSSLPRDERLRIYREAMLATYAMEQAIFSMDEKKIQECLDQGAVIDDIPPIRWGSGFFQSTQWVDYLIEKDSRDLLWQIIEPNDHMQLNTMELILKGFARAGWAEDGAQFLSHWDPGIEKLVLVAQQAVNHDQTEFMARFLQSVNHAEEIIGKVQEIQHENLRISSVDMFEVLLGYGLKPSQRNLIDGAIGSRREDSPNPSLLACMLEYGINLDHEHARLAWKGLLEYVPSCKRPVCYADIVECVRLLNKAGINSYKGDDYIEVEATVDLLISIELGMDPNMAFSSYTPGGWELGKELHTASKECEHLMWTRNAREMLFLLESKGITAEKVFRKIKKAIVVDPNTHYAGDPYAKFRDIAFWAAGCRTIKKAPSKVCDHPAIIEYRGEAIAMRQKNELMNTTRQTMGAVRPVARL